MTMQCCSSRVPFGIVFLFLRSLLVTTSKALVSSSDALVSTSFLLLPYCFY